jgi:hypothetical protein
MSFKSRVHFAFFIIFGFVAELFFLGYLATKVLGAADPPSEEKIFLPASVPERNQLRPISILPITVKGEIVGRVTIYDDPTTQRSADYLELYNNTGHLVAVGWFDRFGIERMAVDRGLLEDGDELEGVFVVLLDGEAL